MPLDFLNKLGICPPALNVRTLAGIGRDLGLFHPAESSHLNQNYAALKGDCLRAGGRLFEDDQFPCRETSLFYTNTHNIPLHAVQWLRPRVTWLIDWFIDWVLLLKIFPASPCLVMIFSNVSITAVVFWAHRKLIPIVGWCEVPVMSSRVRRPSWGGTLAKDRLATVGSSRLALSWRSFPNSGSMCVIKFPSFYTVLYSRCAFIRCSSFQGSSGNF